MGQVDCKPLGSYVGWAAHKRMVARMKLKNRPHMSVWGESALRLSYQLDIAIDALRTIDEICDACCEECKIIEEECRALECPARKILDVTEQMSEQLWRDMPQEKDDLALNLHDMVVVGSYELRIREDGIGGIVIEAWREKSVGGERELFQSVSLSSFKPECAINDLWEKLCG